MYRIYITMILQPSSVICSSLRYELVSIILGLWPKTLKMTFTMPRKSFFPSTAFLRSKKAKGWLGMVRGGIARLEDVRCQVSGVRCQASRVTKEIMC